MEKVLFVEGHSLKKQEVQQICDIFRRWGADVNQILSTEVKWMEPGFIGTKTAITIFVNFGLSGF